jgi:hypothetical protein
MDTTQNPFFPHRLNPDGSYDSICNRCFATVASASTLDELHARDKEHTCRISLYSSLMDATSPTA